MLYRPLIGHIHSNQIRNTFQSNTTSPIVEPQIEQPKISACGNVIINLLHKGTLHHLNESLFVEGFCHCCSSGGDLWLLNLEVAQVCVRKQTHSITITITAPLPLHLLVWYSCYGYSFYTATCTTKLLIKKLNNSFYNYSSY